MTREEIMDVLYKMNEKNKHDLELFDSSIHRTIIQKQIDALEYALMLVARLTGWIPCSDRLPEEDGIYLINDRLHKGCDWVHTAGFKKSSKSWCENHGVYYDDHYGRYSEQERITAWMPLPEPYKEVSHADKK